MRSQDVPPTVIAIDDNRLEGPPEYRMAFARELMEAGQGERALSYAYSLVREFPDNPQVAMSYFHLIIGQSDTNLIPAPVAVAQGVWVSIKSEVGEADSFVIDEGSDFLGTKALAPDHAFSKRLIGLRPGETFQILKPFGVIETWTVVELKSKYLHTLHVLMNEFERRFPEHGGDLAFRFPGCRRGADS